jgi:aminoglycoside phosphotransferase (APT) family kinase protein
MAKHTLPYFADPALLPAKLPAVEEIESAGQLLSQTTGRKVVRIGEHFVVKYGVHVDLLEGETMLFLAQETTQVPVPRIYALFDRESDSGTRTKYIIMELIKGQALSIAWPQMNHTTKEAITSKLQRAFGEMRKLKTPGGFCSIGRRGLPDAVFWTDDPESPYFGPFDTETELNAAMVSKYRTIGFSDHRADWYARGFNAVLQGHNPVFSHGDFQRKNVIVRELQDTSSDGSANPSPDIVMIDWEFAAWYPSYWEYARAIFACGHWKDDWDVWVERILEPAMSECAWVYIMYRELWS